MCGVALTTGTIWPMLGSGNGGNAHTQEIGMNKAQVLGRVEQAKGRIKKVTGSIVGSKTLEEKGRAEEVLGKAQVSLGDAKDALKSFT